jgi:uncharacterized protein (TIGR02145 family)
MGRRKIMILLLLIGVLLQFTTGCKKEEDTTKYESFIDSRDGNNYKTVTIGSQVWMAENLRFLPAVIGPGTSSLTNPYYYVYGYNGDNVVNAKASSNYNTYGVLYNWPAAMSVYAHSVPIPDRVQGACPEGWHLPNDEEWNQLNSYLGGESVAGGKLKETGTKHWYNPNTGASNKTGFTALPGGFLGNNGAFNSIGLSGHWWSATQSSSDKAWDRHLSFDFNQLNRGGSSKEVGFSVRCVKTDV